MSEPSSPYTQFVTAEVDAVGHRVVHGGPRLVEPTADRRRRPRVHRASSRRSRRFTTRRRSRASTLRHAPSPAVPQVAVFDTAFHATIPPEAATYALPRIWREDWGIRRYGFHGLSVQWCSERAPELLGALQTRSPPRRLPPRRWLLGDGGPRRALGRHDDGLLAARGGPDGDALGLDRSWRPPLRPTRARPVRRRGRSGPERGVGARGSVRRKRSSCARGGGSDDEHAQLALGVYTYRIAGAVAAMAAAAGRARRARLHRGRRRALGASPSGRLRSPRRFSASSSIPSSTSARPPTRTWRRPESAARVLVIAAREELVVARAVRALL